MSHFDKTNVNLDEHVQPPFKLINFKLCSHYAVYNRENCVIVVPCSHSLQTEFACPLQNLSLFSFLLHCVHRWQYLEFVRGE